MLNESHVSFNNSLFIYIQFYNFFGSTGSRHFRYLNIPTLQNWKNITYNHRIFTSNYKKHLKKLLSSVTVLVHTHYTATNKFQKSLFNKKLKGNTIFEDARMKKNANWGIFLMVLCYSQCCGGRTNHFLRRLRLASFRQATKKSLVLVSNMT